MGDDFEASRDQFLVLIAHFLFLNGRTGELLMDSGIEPRLCLIGNKFHNAVDLFLGDQNALGAGVF